MKYIVGGSPSSFLSNGVASAGFRFNFVVLTYNPKYLIVR